MSAPLGRSPKRAPSRQPAVLTVCAVAVGIVVDRSCDWRWQSWMLLATAGLVVWLFAYLMRREWIGSLAACALAVAIGGAWQHAWWNFYPAENIVRFAGPQPTPVRIGGTASTEPRWIVAPIHDPFDPTPRGIRSRLVVDVERIQTGADWQSVSGEVPVFIDGQLSGFNVGDQIELVGELSLQTPPGNPGGLDLHELGRSDRLPCTISVSHPDGLRLLARPTSPSARRLLAEVRQAFDQFLWRSLDRSNAALASGILLGMREQLDEAEKMNYLATGTTHLLAISGLHVGILASGVLFLGAIGLVRRKTALWLTIGFVMAYASLVEFQPTVARAAVLISVWSLARITGRAGFSFNALAIAGLVVLGSNPSQLFHAGAQLSFLAVATLSTTRRFFRMPREDDPLQQLIRQAQPWPQRVAVSAGRLAFQAFAVSGLVWLIALPLVAYRFHIVAPVALLANPLLMIPLAGALLSGFLFLAVGWWIPGTAWCIGWVFNGSLSTIRWIVSTSGELPGSYWWTVGPTIAFLFFFYAVAFALFAFPPTRLPGRWAISLSVLVIAVGWLFPAALELDLQKRRTGLEVIVADVGHGGSVLIKLPGGQHVLYDAGSNASPSFTARTISGLLWRERVYHLDALFVSHADLDHYNAVDRLSQLFSIGVVYVPPSVLDSPGPPVSDLLQRLGDRGVPVRMLYRGGMFRPSRECVLNVLHPVQTRRYSNDNAGSIVLELDYAGQRVLLTGDIESEGLDQLLKTAPRTHRLVMAPHHGSMNNAPHRFVPWSRAQAIVVSEDWLPAGEQDLSVFGASGAMVYLTGRDGAVRLHLDTTGLVDELRTWRQRPWPVR